MTIPKLDRPDTSPWRHDDPETSWTLPSRYFYDAKLFEREKQTIFYRTWHMAAHPSEIAKPGTYVVTDVFEQSVAVVRGHDGVVRAFHNVCQHRGHRLLKERRGTVGAVMTCPYHSWAYGLDGALRTAAHTDCVKGFDKKDFGLRPVRLETFGGFLWFNLDPDAPSMADTMPGAETEIRRFCPDIDDALLVAEQDYRVPANWKVVVDNAIEGYHFPISGRYHAELAKIIDYDRWDPRAHGQWWVFKGPPKPGLKEAYGVPVGNGPYQTDWFFNLNLWPYNTIYAFPYADFIGTFLMMPAGPEEALIRCGYYRPDRPESESAKAARVWFGDGLAPEDIDLNVGVQQGLRSFGYDQGRYVIDAQRSNFSEHLVHHFHSLVYDAVHG
ncbi:MAG: aromatic ring-hydroxylating dioxygenase subunit alpha [Alphaproteobacteria bacterium]|nr:aromatic ring-hydroxylating dioxygenase subunit alpha [Alphaproteobacteria bacterium]